MFCGIVGPSGCTEFFPDGTESEAPSESSGATTPPPPSDASSGDESSGGPAGEDPSTAGETEPEGELPEPDGLQFDFDCISIDRVAGPRIVPPAGIQVGFRVLDCNGDPIPPLSGENLQVINDEKNAPFGTGGEGGGFSELGTPSEYALVSVLALDLSDSIVLGDKLGDVIDGAHRYLDGIEADPRPGVSHDVAVVVFARPAAFEVAQPFTTDLSAVRATLEGLRAAQSEGSTDLYGAYTQAVALAEAQATELELVERFVVLLTDGTHEAGDEVALRAAALQARDGTEAHVFTIGIDGAYDPARLAELATTAENFLQVEDASLLQDAFGRIASRVDAIARSNYVVGVCTPVALGDPSLTIRVVVDGSDGTEPADAVTLSYPVTQLDGNTAVCDADEVARMHLSCEDGLCDEACRDMECGCDGGVACGTCGTGSMCDADFTCVPGNGVGPGEASCSNFAWAQGVTLADVEVNQGVGFALATGGQPVSSAPLVEGRDALIRASLATISGFEPRTLRAELRLESPDGESHVFIDERTVSGAITLNDGSGALAWEVPGDLMTPGVQWSVGVYETDGVEGSSEPVRLPAEGSLALDVREARTLKVQLVPVRHQVGTCDKSPNMTQALEVLSSQLLAAVPIGTADVSVRNEPYLFQQSLVGNAWVTLVTGLSTYRSQRAVPNDTFLYGVVDPCGSTGGVGGIGYVPSSPTASSSGPYRTAVGLADGWVFVHELGHNLGRLHVACSGSEYGPDPNYPYSGGRIGRWGWDYRNGALVDPERRDFMSYCSDRWASDYGWTAAQQVLDGMSAWSDTAELRTSEGGMRGLMGVIHPDGTSSWWTTPESPGVSSTSPAPVRLFAHDGTEFEVASEWVWLSDDQTIAVRAPLPLDGDALEGIEIPDPAVFTGSTDVGPLWIEASEVAGL